MENAEKTELLRRKEIVAWQISIAKCYQIIAKREKELEEINRQLLKLE